jgi:hypothetical protein
MYTFTIAIHELHISYQRTKRPLRALIIALVELRGIAPRSVRLLASALQA